MSAVWNGAGRRISICDVGLRDGLQMEARFVPTEDKRSPWCMRFVGRGLREDRGHLLHIAQRYARVARCRGGDAQHRAPPGVTYTALVPNARGAESGHGVARG